MVEARIGAVVPHAPLLVLDDARSRADVALERVRAGAREVATLLAGTLVVVSPHAPATGVYVSTRGGLRAFGVRRQDAAYNVDQGMSARVAARWGWPALDRPLDHGVTVPLRLLAHDGPAVAVGIAENETEVADVARSLAHALEPLEAAVVASVNGGAGVTARGPLTELPRGAALEAELRGVLEEDLGGLHELAPRLVAEGGSCSLGPLLVLAHLFEGVSMNVVAHEWPVGVGYPVAVTRTAS